jgi:hypothetical protein
VCQATSTMTTKARLGHVYCREKAVAGDIDDVSNLPGDHDSLAAVRPLGGTIFRRHAGCDCSR